MIEKIISLFVERRIHEDRRESFGGQDRRKMTRRDANEKLDCAVAEFSKTVAQRPWIIKKMLDRVVRH